MSVIKISANRSVLVIQRGTLGNIGGLLRFTVGQLSAYRIGDLVTV